jgi:glycosyltransferase involved in cell wall biosynthesis
MLLVCRSYPPVIGGSEIEAQRVCAGLLGRGHRVEVICCGGEPMPEAKRWVDPFGVPVRMYGSGPGRRNDFAYAAGVVWSLLRERRNFDLIYFLMPGVQVALGVPLARLLGLRSVMKFAGSNEIKHTLACNIGPMEVAALRKWCEKTMVLNDGMVEEALAAGFERSRLMWMPNPVDTAVYSPCVPAERKALRAALGIPADALQAIFVGRLAPEKELPVLIDGFAAAAAQNPQARLVLVGDGPVRPALAQQVSDRGIAGRVTFAGMQSSDQIARWLQASDVYSLVSSREGLPVSLIEAMATALPSVVTDIPGTAQLIDEARHGFRVPVGDSGAVGAALLRLFNDPGMRAEFGAAARPIAVERFSLDKVLSDYERLFAEMFPGDRA